MKQPRRGGFTLVELLVAIVMGGIVLTAIYRVLANNQRFYRSQQQILDVQQGIRSVAQLLPAELRELDATAGDVLAMGPNSISFRALRNTFFVCAPPVPAAGTIIVRNDLAFGYRSVDPARDRALVFRDGDTDLSSDDQWLDLGITGVTAGATCTDGSGAGQTLTLSGSAIALLDGVTVGSPVRTYEQVTYQLYVDAAGVGWLGVQNYVGGSWSAVSPVAGPLDPANGLSLEYFNASGGAPSGLTDVAQIRVTVRGLSQAPIQIPGRAANLQRYRDEMSARVALRNNP